MTRSQIATRTHALAALSDVAGVPVPHAVVRRLASLPGSDWDLVDGALADGFANAAAERRRVDPDRWAV